jgi:hypothetical protein
MALAYDNADHEVVMFGGFNDAAYPTNDTWVFKGGFWTNITATAGDAPPPVYGMSMAYDAADGYVVAWGGSYFVSSCPMPFPDCNGTWAFQGGKWSALPTRHTPPTNGMVSPGPMVYDAADGYILLFDTDPAQTWTFHAGAWTQINPKGTTNGTYVQPSTTWGAQGQAMAYDAADGYVVLFGGYDVQGGGCPGANAACNETWKFSNGNWTQLFPALSPSARYFVALAYDQADGYLLLYGGVNYTTTYGSFFFNDTWEFFSGNWTRLTASPNPGPRYGAGMVFDVGDNVTLFVGGSAVSGSIGQNNSWEWSSHPTGPPALALAVTGVPPGVDSASASGVGVIVVSGGAVQNRFPYYDTFVSFGDGTSQPNVSLILGYSSSGYAEYTSQELRHTYSSPDNFVVKAWANDSLGASVNLSWVVHVGPALTVTLSSSNDSPIIGQSILINATVTGGHGPFTYAYSGLPFGCYSVNSSSIGCLPTQAGNFTAGILVNDSWGGFARGTLLIHVVFGFTVTAPSSAVVNQPITIALQLPPNVGQVSYSYSSLPTGCHTVDEPQLTCTPTVTGVFAIKIGAVSSMYGGAFRIVTIRIVSAGSVVSTVLNLPEASLLGGVATGGVIAALVRLRHRQAMSPS